MRKALGPVLTTGVALVTAAVVVAIPVAPPIKDVQISTTQLSTSPETLIPFDKSVLNSIPPQSPGSNFSAALAQILDALAAAADRISSEVTSAGSALQGDAVTAPATAPATAPGASKSVAPQNAVPELARTTVSTNLAQITSLVTSTSVTSVLSVLAQDTNYLGSKVVEAAYAVVNAIISTPQTLVKAVVSLMTADIGGAFKGLSDVVMAALSPGLILVGAVGVVIGNVFGILRPQPDPVLAAARIAVQPADAVSPPPPADGADAASGPVAPVTAGPRVRNREAIVGAGAPQAAADVAANRAPHSAADPAAQNDAPDPPEPTPNHAGVATGGRPAATDNSRGTDVANPRMPGANRAKAASPRNQSDRSAGPSAGE